jgi:hypothetical protein
VGRRWAVRIARRAIGLGERCKLAPNLLYKGIYENPFQYEGVLFVCYNPATEWKTFLSAGWELPHNVMGLRIEYLITALAGDMLLKNVGSSLGDATAEFGLDFITYFEK